VEQVLQGQKTAAIQTKNASQKHSLRADVECSPPPDHIVDTDPDEGDLSEQADPLSNSGCEQPAT